MAYLNLEQFDINLDKLTFNFFPKFYCSQFMK